MKLIKDKNFKVYGSIFKTKPKIKSKKIKYIKANLLNSKDCLRATKNIDIVVMCAANSSGAKVMTSTPLVHLTPNLIMNTQILEAAYYNKVKKFIRDGAAPDEYESKKIEIGYEIGDVMWYCAVLAQEMGMDLGHIMENNLQKLADRKARGTLSGSGDSR